MTFDHVRQNIELDRFHDGDESYICDLIRQCTPALRGQIVRLGVDADDGDDLAQETWLRAIERRLQYVGRGSFEAWLSRICYGIYLDQMRSQRRHLSRMSRFSYAEYVSELQEVGYDDESRSVDPVELAVRLRAEIAALPSLQCRVATCRWLLGYSVEQTAAKVGVAAGTVKACLHQARVKLRSRPQT